MRGHIMFVLVSSMLMLASCATTTTTTRSMAPGPTAVPERQGQVEWVRETVEVTQGDPALGAVAGAVVGGVLGGLITGHRGGAAVGAATGAIIGASESQGYREDRSYDVFVRFDDGKGQVFRYRGYPPFRPGQVVTLSSRGLIGRDTFIAPSLPEASPSPSEESLPPSAQPSSPEPQDTPPPPQVNPASSELSGQWAYTQQYGWIWMPHGAAYTFTPLYDQDDPYMYVYYPGTGWSWVHAPWLWGWGPRPYFRVGAPVVFSWYGPDWGARWHSGHRPAHYRPVGRRR